MKRRFYCTMSLLAILSSCSTESFLMNDEKSENATNYSTVIQQRDPNSPVTLSNKGFKANSMSKNGIPNEPLELQYYLGRTYKAKRIPLGDPENISFPAINIEKLYTAHPDYVMQNYIGKSEAKSFAYSSFDRYEENSSSTKKMNAGFQLKLGLFNIGSKYVMSDIFTQNKVNESKRVFGELNVSIKDAIYTLQKSNAINKEVAEKYLHPTFVNEMYNTTYLDMMENYGPFILTDFYSGGRATAVFTGLYNKNSSITTKESDMNLDINASFDFKMASGANGNLTADFGIGRKGSTNTNISHEISNMETSIKTFGGSKTFGSFTVPKDVNDVNIDLSGWVSSLNDKKTHTLVDINDKGLSVFSDYLLEDNFKKAFNQYIGEYGNGFGFKKNLIEPYIKIQRKVLMESGRLYGVVQVFLYNRFGDNIRIDIDRLLENENLPIDPKYGKIALGDIDDDPQDAQLKLNQIGEIVKNKLKDTYKVRFEVANYVYNSYKNKASSQNAASTTSKFDVDTYSFNYPEIFFNFNETNAKKYVNPNNNIIYLLSTDQKNRKYAYAIHDDYVLDTYGIRAWVNAMPPVQISSQELYQYTIVGL